MLIVNRSILVECMEKHADCRQKMQAWLAEAASAKWVKPQDIKDRYSAASFLNNGRVVFNIKGNDYRLVIVANYSGGVVEIRFAGTHKEYDRIDAEKI